MDKYSGQAQIVYKEDGNEYLYWAHLNNPEEIAPFMTKAAEAIALQQQIAEFEKEQEEQKKRNQKNHNHLNNRKFAQLNGKNSSRNGGIYSY